MSSSTQTVDSYLDGLSEDRRAMVDTLRSAVLRGLSDGFEETIQYGMISYVVPLERYPVTYNKQPLAIISIGNQKNYVSLYLMSHYGDPAAEEWLKDAFSKAGKRLDMGKSCLRFRKPTDIPADVIAVAASRLNPEQFIAMYESSRK